MACAMKSLLVLPLLFVLSSSAPDPSHCRCRPHEPCWPAPQEWTNLHHSIAGNLAAVRPAAAVCYPGAAADPDSCKEVTSSWNNSTWRAAHPGALQWENWEASSARDESCYIESAESTSCDQGRISLYSAQAKTAAHIQEAVRFAKKHNLRLAIKNSGHCFLGRSSAPDSLQILTSAMKGIHIVDDFVPAGGPRSEGQAVTLDAGVTLEEMYAALAEKERIAVGGAARSVAPAGGYIQGGGHSFLGPWKGMAADNALEFSVVTARGDLVIANEYQNTDLFWALRGGGGGTFGVVVNATVRTFDEVPLILTDLKISTPAGNPSFWHAMADFHAALPRLIDVGGAGYYFMVPKMPLLGDAISISGMTVVMHFPNMTDKARIDDLFDPLVKTLRSNKGVTALYQSKRVPNIETLIKDALNPGGKEDVGGNKRGASRLYSRDLLTSPSGADHLVSALQSLHFNPGEAVLGNIVAGGAVADNADRVDSALNPAWRRALLHLVIERRWAADATLEEQDVVKANITDVEVPILRGVEGADTMGAYLNEADADETDFQASFWGKNYPELYRLKQKWDPTGLFIARKGVGSEDWDDEGLCRV